MGSGLQSPASSKNFTSALGLEKYQRSWLLESMTETRQTLGPPRLGSDQTRTMYVWLLMGVPLTSRVIVW